MKIKIIVDKEKPNHLPTHEAKKVINILESSIDFENKVLELRKRHNLIDFTVKNQKPDSDYLDIWLDCLDIVTIFALPQYWHDSMFQFVSYNWMYVPIMDSLSIYIENEHRFPERHNDGYLHIVIKEQMSLPKLKRYLTTNSKHIKSLIKKLPSNPTHNIRRVEWAQRAVELRGKENLTYKQIVERLSNEFPDDEEGYINEEYVKQLVVRWKRTVAKVSDTLLK